MVRKIFEVTSKKRQILHTPYWFFKRKNTELNIFYTETNVPLIIFLRIKIKFGVPLFC